MEGVDIACTVVATGDVVAVVAAVGEAVVGGVIEDDAEPATDDVEGVVVTRRSEVRADWIDYIRKQVGGSESLPGSGPVVGLSRPDSGDSVKERTEEAEGRAHCTRLVEDKSAEKAWEEEDRNNGVHMNHMPGNWMGEDRSNPLEVADTELVEGGDHGMGDEKGEVMGQKLGLAREQELARGDVDGELVGVVAEGNVQEAGNDRIRRVDSSQMEGDRSFRIDSGGVEGHMWQEDRVVGDDNGVREAAAVQSVHTNNYHGGHTEGDRRVAGLGWSG